jgi:hypothetical protein
LYEIANITGAMEALIVREPAVDSNFSQWGDRIFSLAEID